MTKITIQDIRNIKNHKYSAELEAKIENICKTGIATAIKKTGIGKGNSYKDYLGIAWEGLVKGVEKLDVNGNLQSFLIGAVAGKIATYLANKSDTYYYNLNKRKGIYNASEVPTNDDGDFNAVDDGENVYDKLWSVNVSQLNRNRIESMAEGRKRKMEKGNVELF